MRQWVLVTSWNPLAVWLYDEMYVRFGAEDFDATMIGHKFMHLTNNSVTKHCATEAKIDGNMWSHSQLVDYLKAQQHGSDVWRTRIRPQMERIVRLSLQSAQDRVTQRDGSFEIFGYDFMLDEDLKLWLIEINASPAIDYSTVLFPTKHRYRG